MAITVAHLEAILSANTEQFDRAMHRSSGRMETVKKVGLGLAAGLAGGLAIGLEKSVHAALDAEKSQARLTAAFKTAHLNATTYKKRIEEVQSSSRKLGFTDDEVRQSLGSLIVATHNMHDATKDLSVAQDIARFRGIGLEQATKMLTLAQTGSQRATKQLGLSVSAVTDAQDKAKIAYREQLDLLKQSYPPLAKMTQAQRDHYDAQKNNIDITYAADRAQAVINDHQATGAKVIHLVTDKLHGQSQVYANTAAGSMEVFKAQLNHIEETVGMKVLPVLTRLTKWLNDQAIPAMLNIAGKIDTVANKIGGWESAFKLILSGAIALKLVLIADKLGLVGTRAVESAAQTETAMSTVSTSATKANTKATALSRTLAGIGPTIGITLLIDILINKDEISGWLDKHGLGFLNQSGLSLLGKGASAVGGAIGKAGRAGSHGDGLMALAAGKGKQTFRLSGNGALQQIVTANQKRIAAAGIKAAQTTYNGTGLGPGIGGLQPQILDDLALGRSMGLVLTSGYRPGAITSTGNVSLHASGRAIDMAGSPSQMAAYAMSEAGRPGVREVIYSGPGGRGGWYPGVGWTTSIPASVLRDHHNHVHVGVGDGIVGARKPRTGDGLADGTYGVGGEIERRQGHWFLRAYGHPAIPLVRNNDAFFERYVGKGISRAQVNDAKRWWTGHAGQIIATSSMSGGGGHGPQAVHVHVAGNLVTERDLAKYLREVIRRASLDGVDVVPQARPGF